MRLRLGVDGTRRLWRIEKNPTKRENIGKEILVLVDGGIRPWDCANYHLEETCIREKIAETEKNYLLRIKNPHNPFSLDPTEKMIYSKEHGTLVLDT